MLSFNVRTTPAITVSHCRWAALSLLVLASGCTSGDTTSPPTPSPVDAVSVTPPTATMVLDEERTLTAATTAGGQTVTGRTIQWSSSAATVATVNGQGVVKAVRAGSARITATSEGKSGSSDIEVRNPVPTIASLAPSGGAAGGAAFTLTVDGTGFASDATVRWNGQNRATTFVSRTRLTAAITAADIASAGTAAITVMNPEPGGGASAASTFTIAPPAVATVTVAPTSAQLVPGETRTLVATLRDAGGAELTGRTVTWSSGATAIASVSTGGVVTGVAPGTATITATAEGQAGTSAITVVPGGMLSAAGGQITAGTVFIDAPAGAVSAPTAVSVVADANPPAHTRLVAGTAFMLAPAATTFAQPVTLRIGWTAAQEAGGANPSLYAMHRWNGTAWVALADRVTDATARTARGRTTAAGLFAIIELTSSPVPVLTAVSPAAVDAGSVATLVTLTGSSFVAASEVLVNDVAIATTFVSATQLTATLSAAQLATAGTLSIRVRTPAPGGGTSAAQTFTVRTPSGTIINVNTTSLFPTIGTDCTLRNAVQAANTNAAVGGCPAGHASLPDVIVLPAGTYSVTLTLNFTDPSGAILRGTTRASTVLDGNETTRIITTATTAGLLRVESLTLQRGSSMSGGSGAAIRTGNALTIDNVSFMNNRALGEGGAIDASVEGPPVIISNSVFSGNEADEGGAIETQSTLTITNTTFINNRARLQQGGALEVGDMLLTITDSDFINNRADTREGGAIAKFGGSAVITNSIFTGNSTVQEGGAVWLWDNAADVIITGSTFSNNSSGLEGSAVRIAEGTLQVTNSTFHNNTSPAGGTIHVGNAAATLRHVTITGATSGGALRSNATVGSITITNSILANNSGGNCAGSGTRTSLGGNVQTDGTCGLNLSTDKTVGDVLLGPLQLNGGRTQTRVPATGSPAIDAAVTAQCTATDQMGATRPKGAACDAGAVETGLAGAILRRR